MEDREGLLSQADIEAAENKRRSLQRQLSEQRRRIEALELLLAEERAARVRFEERLAWVELEIKRRGS